MLFSFSFFFFFFAMQAVNMYTAEKCIAPQRYLHQSNGKLLKRSTECKLHGFQLELFAWVTMFYLTLFLYEYFHWYSILHHYCCSFHAVTYGTYIMHAVACNWLSNTLIIFIYVQKIIVFYFVAVIEKGIKISFNTYRNCSGLIHFHIVFNCCNNELVLSQ